MFSKGHILAEIQRTAGENDGKPLGKDRFLAATGITLRDVLRYWARFGDATAEAGFTPNQLQTSTSDEILLKSLAELARELGKFPVKNEINLRARHNKGFPWHTTFERFGSKSNLVQRLHEWSVDHGQSDIAELCVNASAAPPQRLKDSPEKNEGTEGFVYLAKSGRHFKIGFSNSVGRREYELKIQLPEKLVVIHQIATDDPRGIEQYWHNRFEEKRLRPGAEFFNLTASDVAAFKRRKFM